ncbi:Sphingolipid long chain base-responsive protein LSP1 [Ceratobasidium theobromae]|uniref:Sphingolipid long chain base-responsive protein LSP1 n=1 Tax=Ceratobasidium theobromae TaxID=1582974 RepID=A0A5N5QGF1_9AGAM|nr:Sphingolipid long chain base-responsive protein LSP1 [Ceratobasidium theobromae]
MHMCARSKNSAGSRSSVRKLSHELNGCVKALKSWAQVQNEDLEDVLSHSASLVAQISAVLVRFVSEGRTCVGGKVDATQKRVDILKTKLKPEHHVYTACNDRLENLKKQAEQMGVDIQTEMAVLEDYKRQATRECMDREFAEVVELSNKMRVIGEAGRRIVQEIPLGATPPGSPRAPYTGRERTVALYSQAIIDIHRIQIPNDAHSGPYQSQPNDYDSRSSSDESTPPVRMFTRPSMPEGSLLSAGRQMGEMYPSVISRSAHAPDTASTSGLSSQFRNTGQITSSASSSALTIASIASPNSILSTTNGNIRSRPTVLPQRLHHSISTFKCLSQPFGLPQLSRLTSAHGFLYPLLEEMMTPTIGSATTITSACE